MLNSPIKFSLPCLLLLLASCNRSPETLIWDLRKAKKPADIGWTPKNRYDTSYTREGDIDFTFINSIGKKFHQRCSRAIISRNPDTNTFSAVYAHLKDEFTFDQAEPIIRDIINTYDGTGFRDDNSNFAYPNFDDFCKAMRDGKVNNAVPGGTRYFVVGKNAGIVQISFVYDSPAIKRGKTRVFLMFRTG